jgi:hypothetical protein
MNYPTTFSPELIPLRDVITDDAGLAALEGLEAAGFEAVGGLRRVDLLGVTAIAETDPVQEYCPNDMKKRVGDESMAETWHGDRGGKGVVLLRRLGDGAIAGYGWTSPAPEDEKKMIPGEEVTFAERLGPLAAGQGLGALFAEVIVSGAVKLHGARNVGLETWGSNPAAIKSYLKAGVSLVATRDDYRPTLTPTQAEMLYSKQPGKRRDVRLFMKFGRTFR